MAGWISLNRSIQEHWIYAEERTFSKYEAWLDLLFMVNHAPGKAPIGNQIIDVDRGQRVTSIKKLAEHWSWSRSKVNSFLKMLQSDGMIDFKTTSKYTLVTIVKYDFYQSEKNRKDIKTTSIQHQYDINPTSIQHQSDTNNNKNNKNNDLITNNNDNKGNALREIISFYENNGFGSISEYVVQDLSEWLEIGFDYDVIIKALQIGVDSNKRTMKYIRGIINNWKNRKLMTLSAVEAEEAAFKAKNSYGNQKTSNYDGYERNAERLRKRKEEADKKIENGELPF